VSLESSFSYQESNSSEIQIQTRNLLFEKFKGFNVSSDELMTQLGLFIRSSYLVKFLVLNDLYKRIVSVPGDIIEFGTRFGHNMIVFENLRAIYEPFNKSRHIIGFDTFEGYQGFGPKDKNEEIFSKENYKTFGDYPSYLRELLSIHEKCNVLGHITGNHVVIPGDCRETAPNYFKSQGNRAVALAYFDMGLYEPTKIALQSIKNHLNSGSVILLDEYNWSEAPGERLAFHDVFDKEEYIIENSRYTPLRAIVTMR
jgi:Macrocin-O-methyltransferase (TylF)